MKIQIKKLCEDAIIPRYVRENDSAMDICSVEEYELKPGERKAIKTGIAISFPTGNVILIKDRSGLAAKKGITTLAGVIDPDYRGEYLVVLLNTSSESVKIEKGERIAQILMLPIIKPEIEEVKELTDSKRGDGGFGSSGKF
ncbi:dUTP diphosphatase [Candidatus Woesearchaeota archaeon]|nr:dUTP diphosphatase [Candidatus Woesearchaeota archaeon]MCF8013585.1 dUTP diphosphatase [Candidatus Woesearchaeota archaeon]